MNEMGALLCKYSQLVASLSSAPNSFFRLTAMQRTTKSGDGWKNELITDASLFMHVSSKYYYIKKKKP